MTDRTEPFEALRLPELPDDPAMAQAANDLMTVVAGFPYPGATADGIVLALRWMRAYPDRADVLLGRTDVEARVRTQVAQEIAQELETAGFESRMDAAFAARIARQHAEPTGTPKEPQP